MEESRIREKVVFLRGCTNPNAKYQGYEGKYYETLLETNIEYSLNIGKGYFIYVWKKDCDELDNSRKNSIEIYNGGPIKDNDSECDPDYQIHKNILSIEEYAGYLKGRLLDQGLEKLRNALKKIK